MPQSDNGTAAAALLGQRRDQVAQAAERIDKDPEEALDALGTVIAAPNVGEITPRDMFMLMTQMQEAMGRMQSQIMDLMGRPATMQGDRGRADLQKEIESDRIQREATLELWKTEVRQPVWIQPDEDEQKIHKVTNGYPPRIFRINGLEFPINVGEIVNVPVSVAVLVEHTQRRRPYGGPPQNLNQFQDPQKQQFLAGSNSITVGHPGTAGVGPIIPDGLPTPQPLGLKYDHNGQ